jgi:hypothetical protein
MSLLVDPPFALGQTLGVSSTSDGTGWVGAVKEFTDINPTTGVIRSNRRKVCVAVRNTSGAALLPKKLVTFSGIGSADGQNTVAGNEFVGVVDEFLPAAGVAANDVFWVTIEGPTEVVADAVVAAGDAVACDTAATAGAATAGRVVATTTNAIGRAISAAAAAGDAILAVVDSRA